MLFRINEFNWKDFVTKNACNQFLFVPDAVDVLGYVLRVVWLLCDQLPICSSIWMACGRREPPRLVNLHSFWLVASLLNTLPKWPPYATGCFFVL